MATDAQIQQMLALMQKQMDQLQTLQTENAQLRTATANPAPVAPPPVPPKTKSPDRPKISPSIDEREWELFKDTWNRYKAMTGITDIHTIRMELRAACSPDVNRLLFEYVGAATLDGTTEDELLAHIKSVAVKGTHKEVHRMKFFRLSQMDGETITQYVARLRSQAVLCQFKVPCPDHAVETHVNYTDDMVTQQLISGLHNQHHQSRILSEAAALPTLVHKIERLQCLESTEQSTDLMRISTPTTSTAAPARSSYKRGKIYQPSRNPAAACKGCGRSSHEGKTMARKDCPAFNKYCGNCGIKGHFKAVCQRKTGNYTTRPPSLSNSASNSYNPDPPHCDETAAESSFSFATEADFRLAPVMTEQE